MTFHLTTVCIQDKISKDSFVRLCPCLFLNFQTDDLIPSNMSDLLVSDQEMQGVLDQIKVEDVVCSECGDVFLTDRELRKHTNQRHDHSEHNCEVCGKSFIGYNKYLWHKKTHEMSQCGTCAEFFPKKNFNRHVKGCKMGPELHCDQCDYKTPRKDVLDLHIARKHNAQSFSCDQCDYKTTSAIRFEGHKKKPHKTKKPPPTEHKCSWCDYRSKRKPNVARHELSCPVMKASTKVFVPISVHTIKKARSAAPTASGRHVLLSCHRQTYRS